MILMNRIISQGCGKLCGIYAKCKNHPLAFWSGAKSVVNARQHERFDIHTDIHTLRESWLHSWWNRLTLLLILTLIFTWGKHWKIASPRIIINLTPSPNSAPSPLQKFKGDMTTWHSHLWHLPLSVGWSVTLSDSYISCLTSDNKKWYESNCSHLVGLW